MRLARSNMARGTGVLLGAAALTLCSAAPTAPAHNAQELAYQDAAFLFDERHPNQSSGTTVDIDYRNPLDPAAKPPAVRRVVLVAARGARWDTSVPARCRASDAELVARGEAACPAASRVGKGTLTIDSGLAGPLRFIHARVTFFNNTRQLIYLTTVEGLALRTVIRASVRGRRIVTDVPMLPGSPPDGGAIDVVHTRDPRVTVRRGQRAYFTTPARCPRTRRWTNRITFTYADGTTQSTTSRTPCSRATNGRSDAVTRSPSRP
jgi:hypothetical protein